MTHDESTRETRRVVEDFHEGGTTIDRIVVDGHDAVVLGMLRNVMRRTGEPYEAAVALHLSVEDGRVRRYHVYEDSLAVANAWRGTVTSEAGGPDA